MGRCSDYIGRVDTRAERLAAIVLRTVAYGEGDVIAPLLVRGRCAGGGGGGGGGAVPIGRGAARGAQRAGPLDAARGGGGRGVRRASRGPAPNRAPGLRRRAGARAVAPGRPR